MLTIPTQDEMEDFFDMITKLRTDSRLLQAILENKWAVVPPTAAYPNWVVAKGANWQFENEDLRKALHAAELAEKAEAEQKPA